MAITRVRPPSCAAASAPRKLATNDRLFGKDWLPQRPISATIFPQPAVRTVVVRLRVPDQARPKLLQSDRRRFASGRRQKAYRPSPPPPPRKTDVRRPL